MFGRQAGGVSWGGRTVDPSVALVLLEVMRARDVPDEVLEDEQFTVTLPRRLGLSDVVDTQIRRYREEVRRSRKVSQGELRDLILLIIRRPDAEEMLAETGQILGLGRRPGREGARRLPAWLGSALARRRVDRRLAELFGRGLWRFAPGPFALVARRHLLVEIDPGGAACALVSGLCQELVERYLGARVRVQHTHCRALGDPDCKWALLERDVEVPMIDLEALDPTADVPSKPGRRQDGNTEEDS